MSQVPLWEKVGRYYNEREEYTQIWRNRLTGEVRKMHYDASNDPEFQKTIKKRSLDSDIHQVWDVAFRGKDENGNSTWVWYNYVTGETRPLDYQFTDGELQEKCNESELKENQKTYFPAEIYFESHTGALIKAVVHDRENNPQVTAWQYVRGQMWGEDGTWYCLKEQREPLSETKFHYMREHGEITDHLETIPLSEVVYPRVPNDQVIHRSPYDKDYHKYGPDGSKSPSWLWTVFPSMTAIFLVFGLVALPMEGGIAFGIGLFILWCVGMYKNAEYKSYWDGQRKKQEQNKINSISRMQRKQKGR